MNPKMLIDLDIHKKNFSAEAAEAVSRPRPLNHGRRPILRSDHKSEIHRGDLNRKKC